MVFVGGVGRQEGEHAQIAAGQKRGWSGEVNLPDLSFLSLSPSEVPEVGGRRLEWSQLQESRGPRWGLSLSLSPPAFLSLSLSYTYTHQHPLDNVVSSLSPPLPLLPSFLPCSSGLHLSPRLQLAKRLLSVN